MDKLRVKTCVLVEVNDAGETISVNVADMEYRTRLNRVLQSFDKISDMLGDAEFLKKSEDERTAHMVEEMRKVTAQIDDVFGKDCCKKVFGDVVPYPDYVAEFFKEIRKVLQKYDAERKKELANRYHANRQGADSHV